MADDTSLLKELQALVNPDPSAFNVDREEEEEVTAAKCVSKTVDGVVVSSSQSQLRRLNVQPLSEEDDRYKGSVVERRACESFHGEEGFDPGEEAEEDGEAKGSDAALEQSDDEAGAERNEMSYEEEGDDDDDEEWNESEDPDGVRTRKTKHEEGEDSEYEGSVEGQDDADEGEAGVDGSGRGEDGEELEEGDQQGGVKVISGTDAGAAARKSAAVQTQLKMWNKLLTTRIHFQRVLPLVNSLPQEQAVWSAVSTVETEQKLAFCREKLQKMFNQLLRLQDDLFKSSSVMAPLANFEGQTAREGAQLKRKWALDDDCSALLRQRREAFSKIQCTMYDESFFTQRNEVLLRWYEKTRLASGRASSRNFSSFETNILKQIEQVLSDRSRLLRRTQLKRIRYDVIGKQPATTAKKANVDGAADSQDMDAKEGSTNDYDPEIFDDNDFYQQTLREMIEGHYNARLDAGGVGSEWADLQALKQQTRRQRADHRSSKGRRIRYDVMAKLVNFMAPTSRHLTMSDDARNELCESFFGKRVAIA